VPQAHAQPRTHIDSAVIAGATCVSSRPCALAYDLVTAPVYLRHNYTWRLNAGGESNRSNHRRDLNWKIHCKSPSPLDHLNGLRNSVSRFADALSVVVGLHSAARAASVVPCAAALRWVYTATIVAFTTSVLEWMRRGGANGVRADTVTGNSVATVAPNCGGLDR